jgi:hypothetical protein
MKKIERNVYNHVTEFANKGFANDGNFNFTAGVMESVLISALEMLPKGKRDMLLDRLDAVEAKYFTKKETA